MEPEEVAQKYFDAWNARDGDAIVATFAEGGSYSDPAVPAPLTGAAIGAYAKALWAAFPDLSFEMISVAKGAAGLVAAEWRMSGTHSGGPFNGLPPSGRHASLSGADFLRVEGDKIRSVQGYFDTAALFAALGAAASPV
jgi:steroid delta-isomerase-like uncharacterized protein